jgi:hypothetical protein
MDFLGASQNERECFDLSGVAKIKAERGGLDHERYSRELEEIESKIALGVSEGVELRLLQLLSIFWWVAQEDQGQDLLRKTHGVYAELLVRDGRFADAEDQAHAVIETSTDLYDGPGVRAHLAIAQVETHRGLVPRPHIGLLTLQRCLREVSEERSRALILRDMAELSAIAGRHEEAVGYAQRALDSAGLLSRQAHSSNQLACLRSGHLLVVSTADDEGLTARPGFVRAAAIFLRREYGDVWRRQLVIKVVHTAKYCDNDE